MIETKNFNNNQNTLYIVATPIGNLLDITLRALETLKEVSLILAEDTRVTQKLLSHYHINTPLISYHSYNENEKLSLILEKLSHGNVALVSDAGTPLISDPGSILVNRVLKENYNVVAIPGASAILAGLVVSNLDINKFTFLGFLPKKLNDFKKEINKYINREETLVIYESPLRINKTIKDLYQILGNRNCALTRELTKKFETIYRGNLLKASQYDFTDKGEYVIFIEGIKKLDDIDINIIDEVNYYLNHGLDEKTAIKLVSNIKKVPKNVVYKAYKIDNKE